jgi:hypothetical protein
MKTWCHRGNRGEQVVCNGSASLPNIAGCWIVVEQDIVDYCQAGLLKTEDSLIGAVISSVHSMDWHWNIFYG